MPLKHMQDATTWSFGPVAAGSILSSGVSAVALAASNVNISLWTAQAAGIMGLGGIVGGGVVTGLMYLVRKYDDVQIERRAKYEKANKDSLMTKLEEMGKKLAEAAATNEAAKKEGSDDRKAMRGSLHVLRNNEQKRIFENEELRHSLAQVQGQLLTMSTRLQESDSSLHKVSEELRTARDEMHQTNMQLKQTMANLELSERERNLLRDELSALRAGHKQNTDRLDKLEGGPMPSSDSIPVVVPVNSGTS